MVNALLLSATIGKALDGPSRDARPAPSPLPLASAARCGAGGFARPRRMQQGSRYDDIGAYGKSLADSGRLKEASTVLANAHTPERPNWSILSAQGSVADQLGDHDQAQNYYKAAIRMRPDEPSVMSNLGLSYALSKQLPQAEDTLREAASNPKADMRVRQNLALVLALEGKFGEAEEWSRRDLAPIDAAANVASIRKMIAQSNTWCDLQKLDH